MGKPVYSIKGSAAKMRLEHPVQVRRTRGPPKEAATGPKPVKIVAAAEDPFSAKPKVYGVRRTRSQGGV